MTHAELVGVAGGIHAAILLAALAAYYKYGDRTEMYAKSLQGTDNLLRLLRQGIATELTDSLAPLLANPAPVSRVIGFGVESYGERPANPLSSEAYRERVQEFVETQSGAMVDCRSLVLLRSAWCFWAKFLSWALLSLIAWQLVTAGVLGLLDRIAGVPVPESMIRWAGAVTALGIVACLFPLPFLLHRHDRIHELRTRYDRL